MSISGDLRRHMLSVTPDAAVGTLLKDIRTRPQPETWVLLYPLGDGYAVISVQELARRWSTTEQFLSRRLEELVATASPAIEDGIEGDAQALLGATGYVVVLREGAPFGVLVRPGTRPPPSQVRLVLDQAADWYPTTTPSTLTGDESAIPKTPISAQPSSFEPFPERNDRYVNTDFAREPGQPLSHTEMLEPGQWYFSASTSARSKPRPQSSKHRRRSRNSCSIARSTST